MRKFNSPQQIEKKIAREEMLKQVIEKAVKNGYRSIKFAIMGNITPRQIAEDLIRAKYDILDTLLFDHSFAKAFWGEEIDHIEDCDCVGDDNPFCDCLEMWQYHLQQAVLLDPLIYYYERL